MAKGTGSVTGRTGMAVAPSPLNEVKLDLGVILIVGIVLLLVQERVMDNPLHQLLLLASYGILGMLWIVVRTRRIVAALAHRPESSADGAQ